MFADMTEEAESNGWQMRRAEDCPCGGHFETMPIKTTVLLCHRGTDGRLLCTGMTHPNFPMRRMEPTFDPWAKMHEDLAAEAHRGAA